ncbi:MAG TPA: GNAT family N-acetyltransferase [Alphaproteobacteria bacterium]|nr:GNAT family N-acetyltransferase [Alphaproteobacteria bacterium]
MRGARPEEPLALRFAAATAERLDDLAAVMAESAAAKNCWCAYWYLGNAEYKARWGAANREPLMARIEAGEEPGFLAYSGETPVAWVSVAPRANFARLNRSKTFAPIDDLPVWAVNCFVVAKSHRRQGLMRQLAVYAAEFAFARGAPAVEAYPIEPSEKSGSGDLYVGTVNAFRAAGYVEVARPLPRRPIMRKLAGR